MAQRLKFFQTSFNREQAKKAGVILPSPGVDVEYDTAISQIKAIECELQEYLTRQRKRLGSKVYLMATLSQCYVMVFIVHTCRT